MEIKELFFGVLIKVMNVMLSRKKSTFKVKVFDVQYRVDEKYATACKSKIFLESFSIFSKKILPFN